jgi:hypothetical protein
MPLLPNVPIISPSDEFFPPTIARSPALMVSNHLIYMFSVFDPIDLSSCGVTVAYTHVARPRKRA